MLNDEQVPNTPESTCRTRYIAEGCPDADSYYQEFIDVFWDQRDIDFVDSLLEENEDDALDATQEFYEQRSDDFVTDYAATNPGEDIAESFTYFIFNDQPTDLAKISDQKMNFFYDYPELVQLRLNIRNSLKDII